MLDLYTPGHSPLHRLAPGAKLLALMAGGTALFVLDSLAVVLAALLVILALYRLAGLPLRRAWDQIRPALWILLAILVAQGFLTGWAFGAFIVLRFAALLMLAGLVTLTTRASDMIEAITRGLSPLRPLGVNPAKVGLAFSLALRFIPVLITVTREVREAQKVRGLERSVLAVAIPVAVRVLRMADDISDAIEARGYRP
ncbi:biotin transport system permease protein [Salinihabitans flavidus]|uniref:Biotin transport system permease protein n=1 Tax=Salinihabitans flavidus TaxID=569882 RepID=A0A1H8RFM7_9RHOB|nr:energy-coupling factor transporter transmembrane protein EcfT [Salinihabitans flavidus]SEO64813.1 biotin transport system permease protein [Salinihabitans flavidus]